MGLKVKQIARLILAILLISGVAAYAGEIAPQVDSPDTSAQHPTAAGPQEYQDMDSLFTLYQPYLENITAHEPMYFLVGADPKDSKFQISLKYRFVNTKGPLAEKHPWVKGFHLAYTQTSFWDLSSDSLPFEDTSYKPEVFFISSNIGGNTGKIRHLFLKTGLQHESNGRGGELSRSTNFLYFKPTLIFYNAENELGLQISPKVWTYVNNDDDTNPDLKDYRGYFELETKLGKANSFVLNSSLRWASKGGSLLVDLSYPLNRYILKDLDLYLYLQYSNSLAESLLNYTGRTRAFRIGIAIVR